MRRFCALAIIFVGTACLANAQGRSLDWPFYGGDTQRTGWEKTDSRITRENATEFKLVLKRKLDNQRPGQGSLTPRSLTVPVIIGNLISYRGFKELAIVAGSSDVWAIDADLNKVFWERHLDSPAASSKPGDRPGLCPGGVTATPALMPGFRFVPGARPARGASGGGGTPSAASDSARPAALTPVTPPPPRPLFVLTNDGKLHRLNTSDGSDQLPTVNFLPENSKAASLIFLDNVVYTATSSGCGGAPNAVLAANLSGSEPHIATFSLDGADAAGLGGVTLGTDGTVYVQTGAAPPGQASSKWTNTLLALTPKDLKLKDSFTDPDSRSNSQSAPEMNATTPVVFAYKGRDLIVSAGRDGRLHLLDSQSLGGADHKTPLSETAPISSTTGSADHGIWGSLSTWEETDGTRWVIAPVWGPLSSELKFPLSNGPAPNGAYVAFRLEEQQGKPILTPAWASRDMSSPEPPVLTGGLVFGLSAGQYTHESGGQRPKDSTHATLYVLDATTGKELYSTGNQVTSPGNLTGLTLANGRVYFTTTDSTLYAFGIPLEIY